MTLLSIDELKNLVEQPTGLCVSIYMPTCRLGQETQQNPIRFKNLIRQAEELLVENGLTPSEVGKFLQQEAIAYYQESAAAQRGSTDIKEAVPAAYYGRIEQLFVAVGVQQWGNFDPQNNTIELHPEPETGDEDLLDSAAVQTILNGGTVYAVEPEKVPDRAPLAAVFRY